MRKKLVSDRFNFVQVSELALQYGGIRERGLDALFQTAINLSLDLNPKFVLR